MITQRIYRWVVIILTLFLTWAIGGRIMPATLPGPAAVIGRIPLLLVPGPGGNLITHLVQSLLRVLGAGITALMLATVIGIVMAQHRSAEWAISPWLPLAMTIPTLVVVLVTMVLFQFSEAAVITATVLVTTPYATVTVWEGARTVDNDILSVAAAYDASSWAILREIYLPAIAPAVFGSARYLASMVWKVVVLAETFGMSVGMGAVFRFWYGQGDLEAVLAALFVFVFVMVGIQAGITHGKERLLAWQT